MKKRKKKSRPFAGTEDRKVFSVRIAVKTAEGNANDLIGKECENLIIQNVLRACKRNKVNESFKQYAEEQKRTRLRIKAQRNTWAAVATCLVVALALK